MTALEQPSQVMSTKNSCFWKEKRQLRGQGGHSWKHTTSNCSPHLPFSLGRWVQSLPSQKVHTHPTKRSSAKPRALGTPPVVSLCCLPQHNPEGPLEIVWLPPESAQVAISTAPAGLTQLAQGSSRKANLLPPASN